MNGRQMFDGRRAPTLDVIVECPRCKATAVIDAYAGVPTCRNQHPATFCLPLSLLHPHQPTHEGATP